ncbi:unnamed protein product [Chrysoparadoxa australica]
MDITVRSTAGPDVALNIPLDSNVLDVKRMLMGRTSVPLERQRLIYRGRVMRNEDRVRSYHVEAGHTLHMVARPPPSEVPQATAPSPGTLPRRAARRMETAGAGTGNAAVQANARASRMLLGSLLASAGAPTGEGLGNMNAESSRILSGVLGLEGAGRAVMPPLHLTAPPSRDAAGASASNATPPSAPQGGRDNLEPIRQGLLTLHTIMSGLGVALPQRTERNARTEAAEEGAAPESAEDSSTGDSGGTSQQDDSSSDMTSSILAVAAGVSIDEEAKEDEADAAEAHTSEASAGQLDEPEPVEATSELPEAEVSRPPSIAAGREGEGAQEEALTHLLREGAPDPQSGSVASSLQGLGRPSSATEGGLEEDVNPPAFSFNLEGQVEGEGSTGLDSESESDSEDDMTLQDLMPDSSSNGEEEEEEDEEGEEEEKAAEGDQVVTSLSERRFYVGQWLDVKDTVNQWLEATCISKSPCGTRLLIHYNGWPPRWDEWIRSDSPRIGPFRTRTVHNAGGNHVCPAPNSAVRNAPVTGHDDVRVLLPEVERVMQNVAPVLAHLADAYQDGLRAVTEPPNEGEVRATGLPWDHLRFSGEEQEEQQDRSSASGGDSSDAVAGTRTGQECPMQRSQASGSSLSGQACRSQLMARNAAPLLDRLGRVLTDLAPHVARLGDQPTTGSPRGWDGREQQQAEGQAQAEAPWGITSAGQSSQSAGRARSGRVRAAGRTGRNRSRSPSPSPDTAIRRLIATRGAEASTGNIDIHIHAIVPLRTQAARPAAPNSGTSAAADTPAADARAAATPSDASASASASTSGSGPSSEAQSSTPNVTSSAVPSPGTPSTGSSEPGNPATADEHQRVPPGFHVRSSRPATRSGGSDMAAAASGVPGLSFSLSSAAADARGGSDTVTLEADQGAASTVEAGRGDGTGTGAVGHDGQAQEQIVADLFDGVESLLTQMAAGVDPQLAQQDPQSHGAAASSGEATAADEAEMPAARAAPLAASVTPAASSAAQGAPRRRSSGMSGVFSRLFRRN